MKHRVVKNLATDSRALKKIINWFFREFIRLLRNPKVNIYKTRELKVKEQKVSAFLTVYFNEEKETLKKGIVDRADIFLSAYKIDHTNGDIGNSLIHELIHLLTLSFREKTVEDLEFWDTKKEELFLWHFFAPKQQQIIRSYIPRYTVKKTIDNV
jgi:hypothetical protein